MPYPITILVLVGAISLNGLLTYLVRYHVWPSVAAFTAKQHAALYHALQLIGIAAFGGLWMASLLYSTFGALAILALAEPLREPPVLDDWRNSYAIVSAVVSLLATILATEQRQHLNKKIAADAAENSTSLPQAPA